jgi:hypothetical protein
MNYTERATALLDDIGQHSTFGTPINDFHLAMRRVLIGWGEVVVAMAKEHETRMAALPAARETFDRRTDDAPVGRNVFGYGPGER